MSCRIFRRNNIAIGIQRITIFIKNMYVIIRCVFIWYIYTNSIISIIIFNVNSSIMLLKIPVFRSIFFQLFPCHLRNILWRFISKVVRIMHPNSTITNMVCMKILHLEIININKIFCFFNVIIFNQQILANCTYKLITNKKISCLNKASALYIKWMINCCDYLLTTDDEMNQSVNFTNISFKNRLIGCLHCIRVS